MDYDSYAAKYERFVEEKCRAFVDFPYTVVALNEEAGEVAGWYKKSVLRGDKNFTELGLQREMGDVLFYLVKMAHLKGWTLEDIMQENMLKLEKRGDKIG